MESDVGSGVLGGTAHCPKLFSSPQPFNVSPRFLLSQTFPHECRMLGLGTEKKDVYPCPVGIFGLWGRSRKVNVRRRERWTGTDGERNRNSSDGDLEPGNQRESSVDVRVDGEGVVRAGLRWASLGYFP